MIEYFEHELLPGRKMFRCDKLHGTMQVTACGERWKVANSDDADGVHSGCKNCPIGARHAGVGEINQSPLRGALVCARCHRGTTRLIHRHLCVSCYNRQRELIHGRNARGSVPKKIKPLEKRRVALCVDGKVKIRESEYTADHVELIVAELRDNIKPVAFGFKPGRTGKWVQRELF